MTPDPWEQEEEDWKKPQPSPSDQEPETTNKSTLWALILLVVGLAGGIYLMFKGMTSLRSGQDMSDWRFIAPGEITLDFQESGSYLIYHEHNSTVNEEDFNTSDLDLSPYTFTVTPVSSSGEQISLTEDTSTSYSMGGKESESIYAFSIDEPGSYRIRVEADQEQIENDPDEFVVTIGQGLGAIFTGMGWICLGFSVLFLFMGVSIFLFVFSGGS